MRKFTSSFGDEIVDLDIDETYAHLPKTADELDDLMFTEIGKALCYIMYFHPDWDNKQKIRINKLIEHFTENRRNHYDDVKWLREQVYIFRDETNNMC